MLTDLAHRLRSLFRPRQVDAELDEEIRFHLDALAETYVRQGMTLEEAVRRARMAFGGVDQIKEAHRDARGVAFVDHLQRDVRHGLRQIRRAPGFAAVAILCLGLGIGANTTIFSTINAVWLHPLAVTDPARVVAITRGEGTAWSYPAFEDFRARSGSLDALAMAFPMESDAETEGESSFVTAEVVSGNYGEALGARLALGRWFTGESEAAAVISHALWQRRFNLSPDVLGRQIRSEAQSYTIVGVASREFAGVFVPIRTDLWVPVRTRSGLFSEFQDRRRTWRGMMLFGRLRADATAAEAAAELNAIEARLPAEPAEAGEPAAERRPILAEPLRALPEPGMRRRVGVLASLLAVVVGLVLMIACVNVGSLLLVRGALRQRELTVRRALGATRLGLVRQLLTESLVLAAAGGVCGCLFAIWANRILTASVPSLLGAFAIQFEPAVDWRAVLFAAVISVAATVGCALAPALGASRQTKWTDLRGAAGVGPASRRPIGLVAQVVISFVLLFAAGSFLQTLIRTETTDPGFAVAGRLYAHVFAAGPTLTPDERREIYQRAMEQVQALPGVSRVAAISTLPLMPAGSDCAARPDGRPIPITSSEVSAGYFDTMGITRLAGRDLADDSTADPGVVITRSLSQRLWPDGSALGSRVLVGCITPASALVVGIVADTAVRSLGEAAQPHVYRQLTPRYAGMRTFLIQTNADLVSSVRETLMALAPAIRVYTVQPLGVHLEQRYAPFRWIVNLLLIFGALALGLAAIGLYGVIAYRVALRTQEIGVRMALGAGRADVALEVLRYGLAIVLSGVVIGELCSAAVTRMIGAAQEGIGTAGALTHAAVVAIWIAVALLACYVPAARAARVDPLVALRHD